MDLNFNELGLNELLAKELKNVMKNMNDPNTDNKSVRKITIELGFIPTNNNKLEIKPKVKTSLASINTSAIPYFYDKNGKLYNDDPNQILMDNVTSYRTKEGRYK